MLLFVLTLGRMSSARAQVLPSEPVSFADGHVTISGDVSAAFGTSDTGFFNYSDYEHSQLRLFRLDLASAVKLNDRLSMLGEVRTENAGPLRVYALYVRVRPWTTRAIDIQAGRVADLAPSRRTHVGRVAHQAPLAYQCWRRCAPMLPLIRTNCSRCADAAGVELLGGSGTT